MNLVASFKEMAVQFVGLNDNIDTAMAQGRLFFNLLATFAEFELELIPARTKAGLEAAKARG